MKKRNLVLAAAGTAVAVGAGVAVKVLCRFYESAILRNSRYADKKEEGVYSDEPEKQRAYEKAKEWLDGIKKEEVEIKSFDDLRLHGTFIPAEEYTTTTVVLVHGYRADWFKDFGLMLEFYHEMGVNILLPDDRAHGKSEGEHIGFGYFDHFDVEKWVDYLILRFGENSAIFLHGMSMGAATVMIAAGDDLPKQVRGIIEDCGYSSLNAQLRHNMKSDKRVMITPIIAASSIVTKKKAGYKFSDCSSVDALKRATLPMLFIHGDADDFVPTYMVFENFEACASEDKSMVLINKARHAEGYFVDKEAYEEAVENFIDRIMGDN